MKPMLASEVDKVAFLAAVAAHDAVLDGQHQRPDAAGDVVTVFRLRNGAELDPVIDCPRQPLTRPARYFLSSELRLSWDAPRDLEEMLREVEGYSLPDEQCVPVAPARYQFKRAVNVGRFVQMLDAVEAQQREVLRRRQYNLLDDSGKAEVRTHAQLDPGFDRFPHKARRLFDDWAASSAGRSGARLCDHWVMQLSDWTNPKTGVRGMDLIPIWTFPKKLAEVLANKGDVYSFYGKLQTLDRRVGVPFGWYFYMLHGNRVHDASAERALKAAEDGLIVLEECDYRVLKAWSQRPYGF